METSTFFRGLIYLLFGSCFLGQAQVGVNTTNPQAQLDVRSSNVATPSNTDGILIPRIDEYPVTNPSAAQDGMMVYATGNGSVSKGFYYWDNSLSIWVSIVGNSIEKIDDLVDGKSDNDGTNDGSSIFLGIDAGVNDDGTNNGNTGIGYEALKTNTSGIRNIALGYQTLTENDTGWQNVAIGTYTLYDNITGSDNIGIGSFALLDNTAGDFNLAIGTNALWNNTVGIRNVAMGYGTLRENMDGNSNVAIGYLAGRRNRGSENIYIGSLSGPFTGSVLTGGIFIGPNAGYNETNSNRLYIENSTSSSPLIYGEFDTDFLRINGDLEVEKTTNASASVVTPFGFQSSLKLFERGTSGDFGFEFQYDGSPDKLYLWSRTFAGNEGIRMTWLKDGRVGMNDTSPDARLDIEAINQATPNNTDGILIPRIDAFPATNPGANQNGMLVFLTTDNSFYYWNNTLTTWLSLATTSAAVERINDLVDGRSDNDGSNDGSSVFLGLSAGANDNQTDNRNVGIGYFALTNNTSGSANTAVGSTALISNLSGSNNSAFGRRALYWSTTSSGNSAFGSLAMEDNITGYSNVAFGYEALTQNTTGFNNTAIGYEALEDNLEGDYNTALGYEALANNVVSNNTAVGYQALTSSINGVNNTAVGFEALESNTSGNANIAVGHEALGANTIGFSNTAIGYLALDTNTTGDYNTAIGYNALDDNLSANYNTALGYQALQNITIGSNNTAVGRGSGPVISNLSNTTALGNGAIPLSSNTVRIGNGSVTQIGGNANWSNFSDGRLKTNIQENIVGLEFIKKLRPVSYNYDMDAIARFEGTPVDLRLRNAERLKAQEVQTGFIAQEVEAAAKAVGFDFHGVAKPQNANDVYALRYAEFVVPIVKAMQEQQDMIEAQQKEIQALRSEIEQIKTLLKRE